LVLLRILTILCRTQPIFGAFTSLLQYPLNGNTSSRQEELTNNEISRTDTHDDFFFFFFWMIGRAHLPSISAAQKCLHKVQVGATSEIRHHIGKHNNHKPDRVSAQPD